MEHDSAVDDVLKVGTKSDPEGVAASASIAFRKFEYVILRAIGVGAVEVMVRSLAPAKSYSAKDGVTTWCGVRFATVVVEKAGDSRSAERTALEVTIQRCAIPRLVEVVRMSATKCVDKEEKPGELAGRFLEHFRECAAKNLNARIEAHNSGEVNALVKGLARAGGDVMAEGVELRFYIQAPRQIPGKPETGWPIYFVCFYLPPEMLEVG